MKYDVFISYSSLDQKVAEGVCAYLEQHRIRCFIAYRDIPRGVEWAEVIPQALLECRVMVIIFSDNFNASEEVNREITIAVKSKKIILPFRISDDDFKGLKLYYLCGLNWIDAFPNPEKSFGSLCESVQKLLEVNKETEKNEKPSMPSAHEETEDTPIIVSLSEAEIAFRKGYEWQEMGVPERAVYFYKQAALLGHSKAQLNLGYAYNRGEGVLKDLVEAVSWYRKAAEQGDIKAQLCVGYAYEYGEGVLKDLIEAVSWYRKAAEQGNADGQYKLGICYNEGKGVTKNLFHAIYWCRMAAEHGNADAQYFLGSCYFSGKGGVSRDFSKAFYWCRKAAEQNNADAQYFLGNCFYYGENVNIDYSQAFYWYRKAAEQGHVNAQYSLGVCYHQGRGVDKDLSQAFYWFRESAK